MPALTWLVRGNKLVNADGNGKVVKHMRITQPAGAVFVSDTAASLNNVSGIDVLIKISTNGASETDEYISIATAKAVLEA